MRIVLTLASLALILLALVDGFETILLPRRVTRRYRYARLFYRAAWRPWRATALRLPQGEHRETFLSLFGPLSLLGLFASWLAGLIVGFGLLHWSLGTGMHTPGEQPTLTTYLYLSGTTFFTLGYGDVTPIGSIGQVLAVTEAGLGFGFLAVIISYLPVLYQAFSQREVTISLLDARAGSPPSAAEVLLRLARAGRMRDANPFLAEWERWSAELLGNQMSFPVLGYYRSQHGNQSWLSALTAVLDTCAFLIVKVKDHDTYQAQLTFAMARHAAVDLALIMKLPPRQPAADRLPVDQLDRLQAMLRQAGQEIRDDPEADARLTELRGMYEPFVNVLAEQFLFPLPAIVPAEPTADNWQRSAWMKRAPGIGRLPLPADQDDHFR